MSPEYIDIHTHLNFAAFDEDRDAVVGRMRAASVRAINVGTRKDTSNMAWVLAKQYEDMFASVGLHPIHTVDSHHDVAELGEKKNETNESGEEFDYQYYKELAADPKVVAIGECGLDYYRVEPTQVKKMEDAFRKQIELSIEIGKPLMLHLRNGSGRSAYKDAFSILSSYSFSSNKTRGNLHFFAGSMEEAKPFLDAGYSFSFTGVITFARNYDDMIRFLPIDRIMAETDAPFVSPEPQRGQRNEPRYVIYVVEKIARIKGLASEPVRKQLLANAERIFGVRIATT